MGNNSQVLPLEDTINRMGFTNWAARVFSKGRVIVFHILRMRLFLAGPAAVQLAQKHSIDVQGILLIQFSHLYKFPMYTLVPADTREDPSPKANAPALVAKKNKTQRIQPQKSNKDPHSRVIIS